MDAQSQRANDGTLYCNKYYPRPSSKSATGIFFWFDPVHGHCFGTILSPEVKGGRTLASLCTPTSPEHHVSYSTILPAAWRITVSIWNLATLDKLSSFMTYFMVTNISVLFSNPPGINTSICEQFNSFMRCFKESARHMTQIHFFYLQFFIAQWNEKREVSET